MKIRAELIISGKVQMVGFRYYVKTQALLNRVAGLVENLPKGGVRAVFEAEKPQVEKLIRICRKGTPLSKVTDVKVSYSKPQGLKGFKINGLGFLGK